MSATTGASSSNWCFLCCPCWFSSPQPVVKESQDVPRKNISPIAATASSTPSAALSESDISRIASLSLDSLSALHPSAGVAISAQSAAQVWSKEDTFEISIDKIDTIPPELLSELELIVESATVLETDEIDDTVSLAMLKERDYKKYPSELQKRIKQLGKKLFISLELPETPISLPTLDFLMRTVPFLTTLHIGAEKIGPQGMKLLGNAKFLEVLQLTGCASLTPSTLQSLSSCKKMRQIHLRGADLFIVHEDGVDPSLTLDACAEIDDLFTKVDELQFVTCNGIPRIRAGKEVLSHNGASVLDPNKLTRCIVKDERVVDEHEDYKEPETARISSNSSIGE